MTPLVLAIAYIVGVWIGSMLTQSGLLSCSLPDWLWIVLLVLMAAIPLLNGRLRWSESGCCTGREGD